jgi:hypothetical protein
MDKELGNLVERMKERMGLVAKYSETWYLLKDGIAALTAQERPEIPEVIVALSKAQDDWMLAKDDDCFSNDDLAMKLSCAISDVVAAFLPEPMAYSPERFVRRDEAAIVASIGEK